jgi:mRNA interferase YafQ
MRLAVYKNSFKKQVALMEKRGKSLSDIKDIISLLMQDIPLAEKNRDHSLSGNWVRFRECHIQPDWLLIYRKDEDESGDVFLYLEATGTHSDLFG